MAEESITIYLPLSDDLTGDTADWEEVRSLEDSLRVVLAETMAGMLKVSRAEDGFCRFKIAGPNADVIHKAIQRTVANSRLSPAGFVVLKYADERGTVKVPLRSSNFFLRRFKRPFALLLAVGLGLGAVFLDLALSVPKSSSGEPVRLSPIESWLLILEASAVFLGVTFYTGHLFTRWVGDHYSAMVMKYRQGFYLSRINGFFGSLLLLTRGGSMLHYNRVRWEDGLWLLLGVYLVAQALKRHSQEKKEQAAGE